jgi:hypothetical protein
MLDDLDKNDLQGTTLTTANDGDLTEEQRKKGVNLGYLTAYVFTAALGMFQFGKLRRSHRVQVTVSLASTVFLPSLTTGGDGSAAPASTTKTMRRF